MQQPSMTSGRDSVAASEKDQADSLASSALYRQGVAFFEKFDRYECQELLAWNSSNWLLSTDDFKIPTEPPGGLISQVPNLQENHCVLLLPTEDNVPDVDYKELYQIVREMTVAIFACNQIPSIALEPNFDQSTSCQLPPAYVDTKVGQVMIYIDYLMKALWHGAYFPKEKRIKFTERWRTSLDVNAQGKPETKKTLVLEFVSAGMLDPVKDEDYKDAYEKLLPEESAADPELAEERRFFMNHVDDMTLQMTAFQASCANRNNLFVIDSDWTISTVVRLTEDQLDHDAYEKLNSRLQLHKCLIETNLKRKAANRHQLLLIRFISFLTPFLIGLRKRMRIPDLQKLLPPLIGDDIRTERELPPLMLGLDFQCKNFQFGNSYFHLHGGINVDIETPDLREVSPERMESITEPLAAALAHIRRILDPDYPPQESYPVETVTFEGKSYIPILIDLETYYPQPPQKPLWVRAMHEEVAKLRPKRLPLSDNHLYEQFKKYFGSKRANKNKSLPTALRTTCRRGLVAMFQTLTRRCPPARLGKQDEAGLSLMHHAAMLNRPHIIASLIVQSMDVNVRRHNSILSTDPTAQAPQPGPTPLHLAARCGALDAAACLIANYAAVVTTDADGWSPIHHAAFFDHEPVIKLLVRKHDDLIELLTKNDMKSSPLLLAASSGALSAVRCLIGLNANINRKDEEGNGMVQLAALRFHTNILEYFIEWNHSDVHVWQILVDMLNSNDSKKMDSSVKCLEVLSTSSDGHWKHILNANGVPALVKLLRCPNDNLKAVAASVLCNISEHDEVRLALSEAQAAPILISLLSSPVDDIQSRASIVISDIACVSGNQQLVAELGGVEPLVALLDSELEDVLVNAVNAVRVLCSGNSTNQELFAAAGVIEPLVEFLTTNSEILQAGASAAIASLTRRNRVNQDAVIKEGAVRPLVDLIRGRTNVTVQVKAASAVESLAENNPESQQAFLELEADKALLKLIKVWSVEVKEQGALALWALAGHTITQQKYISDRIGIQLLIEIIMTKSEKLQYTGCMALISLARENTDNQNKIAAEGGIQPLVRLLRSVKTSDRVLLTTVRTLGQLCVGVAHVNNKNTQKRIAEEDAISVLVNYLLNPPNDEIQVEVACSLGCIVLGNKENQRRLKEEEEFDYDVLLKMVHFEDPVIRLKSCLALAIFAFNNTLQQFAIREAGGVAYSVFDPYLNSKSEYERCHAAFQIVVLARDIVDMDQVSLTALGVTSLVEHLKSEDDNVVILAAGYLSSLAHTRAGIPDAMITSGAVDHLVSHLHSVSGQVRTACAVALGYLTFNRTAARMLLKACRETPTLYDRLVGNIPHDSRISPEFVDTFQRAQLVGLPCMFLEANGGPPSVPPPSRAGGVRSVTRMGPSRRGTAFGKSRVVSAPAAVHRGNKYNTQSGLPSIGARSGTSIPAWGPPRARK